MGQQSLYELKASGQHQYNNTMLVCVNVCSDSDNISFTYTEHIVPLHPQWENQGMFLVGVHKSPQETYISGFVQM